MTILVFVGPSLPAAERAALVAPFRPLPPAAQGDIARAVQLRPRAIGLIDGYFAEVPAVWHKEILFAMAEGIHVFGAASMGALRAAELQAFGMQGVGRIFADYQAGRLEDDDEVAVVHGPAEAGYAAASEALVDIRATLAAASGAGVLDGAACAQLLALAKATFYAHRRWPDLLRQAAAAGLPAERLAALEAFVAAERISQKTADARLLLQALQRWHAGGPAPLQVGYRFEWTQMWDAVAQDVLAEDLAASPAAAAELLDELRLQPAVYQAVLRQALLRWLAGQGGRPRRPVAASNAGARALTRWRAERGLFSRQELDRWLLANDLDQPRLERLLAANQAVEALADGLGQALAGLLLDQLRLQDDYADLAARAADKRRRLAELGLSEPLAGDLDLAPIPLRFWYFSQRLGQPLPDDLAAFAARAGFADLAAFDLALRREYLYDRLHRSGR